jgi:nitrogenase molybdenum-iron protein alpha/beta subunit
MMSRSEAVQSLTNLIGEDVEHIIDNYNDPNSNEMVSVMITGYDLDHIVSLLSGELPQ